MSLRFAPARHAMRSPIARALGRRAVTRAANDNGECEGDCSDLLHASLRHFGAHGLGAARAARSEAVRACADGDRQGYDWWVGICRTLDRRLARSIPAFADSIA